MFTVPRGSSWSFLDTFESLISAHPASILGRSPARAAERAAKEVFARMPAHLRDDVGLPAAKAPEPEHPALTRARNLASRWGS